MDRIETQRLTFMKALIGAAWLDKTITAEALNVLKTYLRRVDKSEEEWVALKPYLQRTVREREAKEAVDDFLSLAQNLPGWEKEELKRAAADLIEVLTDETDDVFLENLPQLFEPGPSANDFIRAMRKVLAKGGVADFGESRTGDDYDEFVRSRIMFSVRSKMLDLKLESSDLSTRQVAYITSLAALLGRIAHADEDFSEEEKIEIANLLKETTSLEHDDIDVIMSTIVEDTLKGLDLKSLTRTYYNLSTEEQREQLLNCLFLVAGADGHIDPSEVDEIERIAVGLNMSHRDIIRAKATAMETVRKRLSLE